MIDKLLAGLGVAVLILGLLLVVQGYRIDSLKGDLGRKTDELTEAYKRAESVEASNKATVEALEAKATAGASLATSEKKVEKRIEEVIQNGKASGNDITVQLSNSMWLVYCEGGDASCSSRHPIK